MGDGEFDPADMELDLVDDVEPHVKSAIEDVLGKESWGPKVMNLSDRVSATIQKALVDKGCF